MTSEERQRTDQGVLAREGNSETSPQSLLLLLAAHDLVRVLISITRSFPPVQPEKTAGISRGHQRFLSKGRLRSERRNSKLRTCEYSDLGRASDWLKIHFNSAVLSGYRRREDIMPRLFLK